MPTGLQKCSQPSPATAAGACYTRPQQQGRYKYQCCSIVCAPAPRGNKPCWQCPGLVEFDEGLRQDDTAAMHDSTQVGRHHAVTPAAAAQPPVPAYIYSRHSQSWKQEKLSPNNLMGATQKWSVGPQPSRLLSLPNCCPHSRYTAAAAHGATRVQPHQFQLVNG